MADITSVANNLLSAGKGALKSVAEILSTLDSMGALPRLRDDEEAMKALDTISSFIWTLSPSSGRPSVSIRTGVSRKAGMEHLASTTSEVQSGKKKVVEAFQMTSSIDDGGPAEDEESLGYLSLQDGRDESGIGLSTYSTAAAQPPVDYSDLFHGPRPPSSNLTAALGVRWKDQQTSTKPLYSILVYFPVLSGQGKDVSVKEKEMLERIVLSTFGGSGGSASSRDKLLTTQTYPRIRLLGRASLFPQQNLVLVLDDNPERLRAAQRGLVLLQRTSWGERDNHIHIKDKASIFVRSWGERPSILVFSCNMDSWKQRNLRRATERISGIRHAPASVLATALIERYPILSQFQPYAECSLESSSTSSLCRLPGGGGRVHHTPGDRLKGHNEFLNVFFPLFPGGDSGGSSPEDLEEFMRDFVPEHSPFVYEECLEFTIDFQILSDPGDPSKRLWWPT